MKKSLLPFLLSGLLLLQGLTGLSQSAKIQVIHNAADPALDTIDVYTNGLLALDNFVFRTATPFIDVPPAITINVGVAPANSSSVNDTIKNFEFVFGIGQSYCVMATGVQNTGNFAPNPSGISTAFNVIITAGVKLVSSTPGNTELYCANGVTDAASTDFLNRNVALMADNLVYGNSSGYSSFPSQTYTFDILDSAQTAIDTTVGADFTGLVDSAIAVFTSGFIDPASNQNGPGFGVFGAMANGQVFEFPPVSIAYLQAIHNCADPAADSLDIWALGFNALDNFKFRNATNYIAVPAGIPLDVGVALGNSTVVGDTIRNFPVVLENGKNYIAMACGVLNPANFAANPDGKNTGFDLVISENGRALAQDPAKVDFMTIHGSTDDGIIDLKENGGPVLVDNLAFGEIAPFVTALPAAYNYDVTDSSNANSFATYAADLTPWTGKGMVVFTSGFRDPAANQNGPSFGLYAALTDGTVIPFPDVTGTPHPNLTEDGFSLGPVPAGNLLSVYFSETVKTNGAVSVINMTGQELLTREFHTGEKKLDLETGQLASGMYLVRFMSGPVIRTMKFIK